MPAAAGDVVPAARSTLGLELERRPSVGADMESLFQAVARIVAPDTGEKMIDPAAGPKLKNKGNYFFRKDDRQLLQSLVDFPAVLKEKQQQWAKPEIRLGMFAEMNAGKSFTLSSIIMGRHPDGVEIAPVFSAATSDFDAREMRGVTPFITSFHWAEPNESRIEFLALEDVDGKDSYDTPDIIWIDGRDGPLGVLDNTVEGALHAWLQIAGKRQTESSALWLHKHNTFMDSQLAGVRIYSDRYTELKKMNLVVYDFPGVDDTCTQEKKRQLAAANKQVIRELDIIVTLGPRGNLSTKVAGDLAAAGIFDRIDRVGLIDEDRRPRLHLVLGHNFFNEMTPTDRDNIGKEIDRQRDPEKAAQHVRTQWSNKLDVADENDSPEDSGDSAAQADGPPVSAALLANIDLDLVGFDAFFHEDERDGVARTLVIRTRNDIDGYDTFGAIEELVEESREHHRHQLQEKLAEMTTDVLADTQAVVQRQMPPVAARHMKKIIARMEDHMRKNSRNRIVRDEMSCKKGFQEWLKAPSEDYDGSSIFECLQDKCTNESWLAWAQSSDPLTSTEKPTLDKDKQTRVRVLKHLRKRVFYCWNRKRHIALTALQEHKTQITAKDKRVKQMLNSQEKNLKLQEDRWKSRFEKKLRRSSDRAAVYNFFQFMLFICGETLMKRQEWMGDLTLMTDVQLHIAARDAADWVTEPIVDPSSNLFLQMIDDLGTALGGLIDQYKPLEQPDETSLPIDGFRKNYPETLDKAAVKSLLEKLQAALELKDLDKSFDALAKGNQTVSFDRFEEWWSQRLEEKEKLKHMFPGVDGVPYTLQEHLEELQARLAEKYQDDYNFLPTPGGSSAQRAARLKYPITSGYLQPRALYEDGQAKTRMPFDTANGDVVWPPPADDDESRKANNYVANQRFAQSYPTIWRLKQLSTQKIGILQYNRDQFLAPHFQSKNRSGKGSNQPTGRSGGFPCTEVKQGPLHERHVELAKHTETFLKAGAEKRSGIVVERVELATRPDDESYEGCIHMNIDAKARKVTASYSDNTLERIQEQLRSVTPRHAKRLDPFGQRPGLFPICIISEPRDSVKPDGTRNFWYCNLLDNEKCIGNSKGDIEKDQAHVGATLSHLRNSMKYLVLVFVREATYPKYQQGRMRLAHQNGMSMSNIIFVRMSGKFGDDHAFWGSAERPGVGPGAGRARKMMALLEEHFDFPCSFNCDDDMRSFFEYDRTTPGRRGFKKHPNAIARAFMAMQMVMCEEKAPSDPESVNERHAKTKKIWDQVILSAGGPSLCSAQYAAVLTKLKQYYDQETVASRIGEHAEQLAVDLRRLVHLLDRSDDVQPDQLQFWQQMSEMTKQNLQQGICELNALIGERSKAIGQIGCQKVQKESEDGTGYIVGSNTSTGIKDMQRYAQKKEPPTHKCSTTRHAFSLRNVSATKGMHAVSDDTLFEPPLDRAGLNLVKCKALCECKGKAASEPTHVRKEPKDADDKDSRDKIELCRLGYKGEDVSLVRFLLLNKPAGKDAQPISGYIMLGFGYHATPPGVMRSAAGMNPDGSGSEAGSQSDPDSPPPRRGRGSGRGRRGFAFASQHPHRSGGATNPLQGGRSPARRRLPPVKPPVWVADETADGPSDSRSARVARILDPSPAPGSNAAAGAVFRGAETGGAMSASSSRPGPAPEGQSLRKKRKAEHVGDSPAAAGSAVAGAVGLLSSTGVVAASNRKRQRDASTKPTGGASAAIEEQGNDRDASAQYVAQLNPARPFRVGKWTPSHVFDWAHGLGLADAAAKLRKGEVSGAELLANFGKSDLELLEITKFSDLKVLMPELTALRERSEMFSKLEKLAGKQGELANAAQVGVALKAIERNADKEQILTVFLLRLQSSSSVQALIAKQSDLRKRLLDTVKNLKKHKSTIVKDVAADFYAQLKCLVKTNEAKAAAATMPASPQAAARK